MEFNDNEPHERDSYGSWNNAVAENFFKKQLIYGNKLISKEQMKLDIFDPSKANWRSNTLKFGTTEKSDIPL